MSDKTILVIDDEADIREVAQLSLEINSTWQVLTANSGQVGLVMAADRAPDAILLDVMMPDLDGLTTLSKLQMNPVTQNIPVILLTAKVQATEPSSYTQLGATAVLRKPFDPVHLAEQIAQILNWSL